MNSPSLQVAYVSTYVPKKCGLATYTHHLRQAVMEAREANAPDPVIAMCNPDEVASYGENWHIPLLKSEKDDYRKIAETLNRSPVDVVSLQHEFGIFGGEAGSHVLELLQHLTKPVVTTFHTVFEKPAEPYASVQAAIAARSDHVHVMNRKAIGYLHEHFSIPPSKISFIPHGAPVPVKRERQQTRKQYGWENRKVVFQFGLLSRGKGIESLLRALATAVRAVPDLLYIIAGQTHPEVRKHEGEAYREELTELIKTLGLENHVRMINRYVPEEELVSLISACDLYVTPYPGMQQITSGTLAYAAGLGRPILSTPYSYAKDLMQGNEDYLLPFGDTELWSAKIIELFSFPELLARSERKIAEIGKSMQWPQVGAQYLGLLERVTSGKGWSIADVV
ncbi:glycosyltransferase family 4 protein [Cohnella thailandensis]|uniref:Glycosyltransferase n=1 Tax=Cohnella thailandensis TaxID=557557 RepID=A0A841T4W1_9BACL|nr:glycosyltransferase family 4 protein [Cohnella thailandensis]MBB6637886.1 glycosyltransferase [Cohnella thailandensis]MBP1977406.1 glycosyltransferase involved in cell wall biosynthesis [Cohnella thailandensis]